MKLPSSFLTGHIAHRGLHSDGVPENSIAAFRAAIGRNLPIELDVQRSGDNAAIAFHDDTLDRLTGKTGRVSDRTAAELSGITLSGASENIPRFSEVLTFVAGRVPLLIEIKDQDGEMGPDVGPLESAVIAALNGYEGDVAIMSFNPHAVAYFRDHAPDLPRGLVTSAYEPRHWPNLPAAIRDRLREIPDYDRLGCSFISHQGDALAMPRVAELKAQGAAILCWTIRSPAQEAMALKIADAVTFEGYLP